MASKVTNEDILRINEIYYKTHTYAETARQTGFAASTVKKYIIKDWKPVEQKNISIFDIKQLPDFTKAAQIFRGINNYGYLCTITDFEKEQMKQLWEELAL